MYIEKSINPVSSAFLRSNTTQFNHSKETFEDIFQRTLNNKSGSRPPKIELTGVLTPCRKMIQGYHCKFRLETDSNEYFLSMSDALAAIARKIEWEEVTVRGYLDPDDGLFEVEKISLSQKTEPFRLTTGPIDSYFELDQYKRTIAQRGKLDLSLDYLAS
jgi:hypothetical protein